MKRARAAGDGSGPARRATIREVADAAGVSRSTASRALTGHGYVAAAVRNRVRDAARSLGYVPDVTARHLRQQNSRSIGVLVSDLGNPFYAGLAAGISQQARKRGYTMMLADDGGSPEVEAEAAETFVALRVAGVIVTPGIGRDQHVPGPPAHPGRGGRPAVLPGACDAVVVDNESAARTVTAQLLNLGHRRIALVIDEMHWTTGRNRVAGYRAAFAEAGVRLDESLVVTAGWDVDAARIEVHKLFARRSRRRLSSPPTMFWPRRCGGPRPTLDVSIPERLSLVAFDDVAWMSLVRPGVTAVAQDPVALGEAAIAQLSERVQAPLAPVRTVLLSASVTTRGSTAPPYRSGR
jgi:DNA-binding LacI/PurR family transcriptional regulator